MRWPAVLITVFWFSCGTDTSSLPDAAGPDAVEPDAQPVERRWHEDVRLTDDGASSQVTYNFAWSVAADESGGVHAVWFDERDGAFEIYYRRSTDGGATWETETALTEDDDIASEHPAIAVAGDHVYVVWHDYRGGNPNVYLRRSMDRGVTWEAEIPLTTSGVGAHASIAAVGSYVQVVHGDGAEVSTRRSEDSGETWGESFQVSQPGSYSWVPNVALRDDDIYIAWVDYRDANEEEYLRRSTDGGRSWLPAVRMSDDIADSWAPSVAVSDGIVHFFWFDRRDAGYSDLDVEATVDQLAALVGISVEPTPPRNPAVYYLDDFAPRLQRKMTAVMNTLPAWVAAGGDAAQAQALLQEYETRFVEWVTSWEIYYRRSDDGGDSFGPETRLTQAIGRSERPSVAVEGQQVNIVWYDGRDGRQTGDDTASTEIYSKRSLDAGLSWEEDVRLTEATGTSMHATAAAGAGSLHVVWYDDRDGNEEIYYKRLAP